MRTIRRLIEAKKLEREENGESGFSLIELIIVVVILGILVAIAIPIFSNIQDTARLNAAKAAAASAATQWSTGLAANPAVVKDYNTGDAKLVIGGKPADATASVGSVCATAYHADLAADSEGGKNKPVKSGPGC